MDIISLFQFGLQDELAETLAKFPAHLDLFELAKMDLAFDDVMAWKTKHPEEWTNEDVLEWIYSVAAVFDMKMDTVRGENFQHLNGQQLCLLSVDEFLERDKANGPQLYHCLQDLLQQSNFIPPTDFIDMEDGWEDLERLYPGDTFHRNDLDNRFESVPGVHKIPSFSVFLDPPHELPFDELSSSSPYEDGYSSPPIPAFLSSYTVDSDVRNSTMQDSGYESAESCTDSSTCTSPKHVAISSKCSLFSNSQEPLGPWSDQRITDVPRSMIQVKEEILTCHSTGSDCHPKKRGPGRPPKRNNLSLSSSFSSSSSSSSSSDGSCLPSAPKKSKKKNTHLWKFMRALLEDPVYNPVSIKWENKQDGVFRIVPGQSKFIAKLWGQRKNNPSMTFDKMSRSLRWCRTYGFLSEVPKDGNYPKKLCFRFGDRAANWQQ